MRWPAEQVAVNEPQAGGRSGRGRRAEGPSLMVAEGGGGKRCEKYTRGHTQSPSGPGTVTSVYYMLSCVLRGFRDTKIRDIVNPFPWDGGPEPSLAGKTDPVGGVQTALLCWRGRRCQRAQQVDLEAVPGAAPPAECGGERWAGSVAGKGMGRARWWVPCGWAGDPGKRCGPRGTVSGRQGLRPGKELGLRSGSSEGGGLLAAAGPALVLRYWGSGGAAPLCGLLLPALTWRPGSSQRAQLCAFLSSASPGVTKEGAVTGEHPTPSPREPHPSCTGGRVVCGEEPEAQVTGCLPGHSLVSLSPPSTRARTWWAPAVALPFRGFPGWESDQLAAPWGACQAGVGAGQGGALRGAERGGAGRRRMGRTYTICTAYSRDRDRQVPACTGVAGADGT